ncbi:hypothetical protein [Nocardia sp. NBC_01388]|uniref:hypothetical protein n=1 Tax=Nocardia sp. NBC_01388 TaxID=2903596 RepID=UPI003244DD0A
MQTKKFTVTAAMLIAALGMTAGNANAAPAADTNAIDYTFTNSAKDVVINTDAGSLVVEDGAFKIKAANGAVVAGTPLNFRVDDFVFPITAEIKDRTATLTPQFDEAHAVYQPVALPYEDQAPFKSDYDREQAAWNRMTSTISTGATIGTLVGGLGGAAVGCVVGMAVGATLTAPLALMFGAGPIGGCIAGAAAVGFLGTVAGQLFVTAPVAILAAAQYFTTVNSPLPGK